MHIVKGVNMGSCTFIASKSEIILKLWSLVTLGGLKLPLYTSCITEHSSEAFSVFGLSFRLLIQITDK